ncbi:MAG: hypothetical protein QME72_08635 [Rhodococcus sp. (in: high G+C Gram-positive bacteria)]|nr:hypothetical protein [Rhodococcus sp. (in: high G+C Gram-positive bacteria)]MDI6627771.1 hypothetical protein [Rhodococcus sp. (in: high G+C Gram-positive bacteria)]
MATARGVAAVGMVAIVLVLPGCSSLGPDAAGAGHAASSFHAALRGGNGVEGCALLAADTVEHVEKSSHAACEKGILDSDIPDAEQIVDVRAYGRAAQVRMDTDTVFLTVADGGWKVTAAGCRAEPGGPYDCMIEGQ